VTHEKKNFTATGTNFNAALPSRRVLLALFSSTAEHGTPIQETNESAGFLALGDQVMKNEARSIR
jgi:hypothetical protein